jgi:hypothetical protein
MNQSEGEKKQKKKVAPAMTLLFTLVVTTLVQAQLPPSQHNALMTFYNEIDAIISIEIQICAKKKVIRMRNNCLRTISFGQYVSNRCQFAIDL